jgi:regulation of enolase protein 1 (concanavalin A-like superfamily)
VVQTIGDENFDVSVKIDSPLVPTDASTSEGLMVLHNDENFITFSLTTDGSKIGLRAQTTTGGVTNTVLDDTDFSAYQNPMYLRLTRTGSAYVTFYSVDGTNWLQASNFTDTDVPTQIGPFASNYNDTPANAVPVVMSVDRFDVQ